MASCKGIRVPAPRVYTNCPRHQMLSQSDIWRRHCDILDAFRVFPEMHTRVGQHQTEQQHRCQGKSEAIEIIVEFAFRDMPNHFFIPVGNRQ